MHQSLITRKFVRNPYIVKIAWKDIMTICGILQISSFIRSKKTFIPSGTVIVSLQPLNLQKRFNYLMCNKIKTIIIEDENILRDMLVKALSLTEGFEVLGDWEDGESALKNLEKASPDIAIVDYRLPGMDGIEFARKVSLCCPGIKTLILTADRRETLVKKAFNAGATGFLYKEARFDELMFAIKAVGRGDTYLYTGLIKDIIILKDTWVEEESLAPECVTILKLASKGLANKEIADRMKISLDTVKYRFEQILKTLNARDRTNAVVKALQMGIIDVK